MQPSTSRHSSRGKRPATSPKDAPFLKFPGSPTTSAHMMAGTDGNDEVVVLVVVVDDLDAGHFVDSW